MIPDLYLFKKNHFSRRPMVIIYAGPKVLSSTVHYIFGWGSQLRRAPPVPSERWGGSGGRQAQYISVKGAGFGDDLP